MKVFALLVFSTVASTVFGAAVGETYDQLIAEKGKPKSQMNAGNVRIVTYTDARIKLRDDIVISITPIAIPPPTPTPTPAPSPTPAPDSDAGATSPTTEGTTRSAKDAQKDQQVAVAEEGMKKAIEAVQKIVNQPVTAIPMNSTMHPGHFAPGWFHDGAITPDFATVDVRKTQELIYDKYQFVTSDLNPNVVFQGNDLEFNPMLKFFYVDRTRPKKKLTERDMLQINQLYRRIGEYRKTIQELKPAPQD
jgi:hypothetical protein